MEVCLEPLELTEESPSAHWLVADLPLWKIWKSVGIIIPHIWKNKKCYKPPISSWFDFCIVDQMNCFSVHSRFCTLRVSVLNSRASVKPWQSGLFVAATSPVYGVQKLRRNIHWESKYSDVIKHIKRYTFWQTNSLRTGKSPSLKTVVINELAMGHVQ